MALLTALDIPVKPFGDPGPVGWIVFGVWMTIIITLWVRHVRKSNRDD